MDQELRQQLDVTRNSFYKLQQNFNNNLLVIEQLEQENQELRNESDKLKAQMQMQMEDLLEKEAEVWEEKIVGIKKDYARRMKECEEQCQNETQSIIEMMNEKTSKEIKYERQKYNREKQQLGSKVLQYEESINEYIKENGKLGEAIKELRYQKEEMEGELRQLIAEKSSYNSKFALHQKELENIRNSNNEWEEVLKDKVREVNKEKQKLEEEICEIKVHYKNKLSKAKQESVRKMEDILTEKEKNSKQMLQQSRQIKYKYDVIVTQIEKMKMQNEGMMKERDKLQRQLNEYGRKMVNEKEIETIKKIYEQDKKYLNNEINELKNQKYESKEQIRQVNEKREEAQKAVERLKMALQTAQKQVQELEARNKRWQREKERERKEKHQKRDNEVVYYKYDQEDRIQQSNNQLAEYSKYFSEDMGPVDDNFFEGIKSSLPKSPKVVKQNSANHQLMRKIGQLQVEVEEYKRVIKTMTDEMERLKMNWTQKLGLKEQQIKLCRDEALLLRARINQKDEQIIGLGNTRNEGKELREKNERLGNELNEVKVGLSEKSVVLGKIEEEMKQLQQRNRQYVEQINSLKWERDILDNLSTQLRTQLQELKQKQTQNIEEQEEDSFQEIKMENISDYQPDIKSTSQSKSKSRSKSGNKYRRHKPNQTIDNRSCVKLKDMIKRKKELEMQGKKAVLSNKQVSMGVEKRGTDSQKEILQVLKRKSKQKSRKVANYAQLRDVENDE